MEDGKMPRRRPGGVGRVWTFNQEEEHLADSSEEELVQVRVDDSLLRAVGIGVGLDMPCPCHGRVMDAACAQSASASASPPSAWSRAASAVPICSGTCTGVTDVSRTCPARHVKGLQHLE